MTVSELELQHKSAAERLLDRIHQNSLYGLHPEEQIKRMQRSVNSCVKAMGTTPERKILFAGCFTIRKDPETGAHYWVPKMHNPSRVCTNNGEEGESVESFINRKRD